MSDYLTHLAARILDTEPVIKPRIRSRFETGGLAIPTDLPLIETEALTDSQSGDEFTLASRPPAHPVPVGRADVRETPAVQPDAPPFPTQANYPQVDADETIIIKEDHTPEDVPNAPTHVPEQTMPVPANHPSYQQPLVGPPTQPAPPGRPQEVTLSRTATGQPAENSFQPSGHSAPAGPVVQPWPAESHHPQPLRGGIETIVVENTPSFAPKTPPQQAATPDAHPVAETQPAAKSSEVMPTSPSTRMIHTEQAIRVEHAARSVGEINPTLAQMAITPPAETILPKAEARLPDLREHLPVIHERPEEESTIHIHIGRIDVRTPSAARPKPSQPRRPRPTIGLDEYLRQRDEGGKR